MVSPSKGEVGHLSKTCTGGVPSPRAFFINVYRKYIVVMKPYDNQLRFRPGELRDNFYLRENMMPSVNVLIGVSGFQKTEWIMRYKEDRVVVVHFLPKLRKRKLVKQIKSKVKDKDHLGAPSVILTSVSAESFLAVDDRSYLIDLFPNYKKHAVVWEQDLEKMIRLGYERPTLEEGFDDFTYHLT